MPTENGERRQDATETGILFLDNPQLYNLVVQRIAGEVEGRLSRRILIVLSFLAVVLSVAATFYHNAIVDGAADAAVDDAIGELREQVEVAALSFEITNLVNSIREGNSFNPQEKDAAVKLLERAATLSTFTDSPTFLVQLEKLLIALAEGDVGPDINRLEEIYRNQISKSDRIVSTLVLHYGFRILSTPGAPDDWDSGTNAANLDRYERYAPLAKSRGYPEFYIFFRMLIEDLRSNRNENVVRQIIDEIEDLNEEDSENFWKLVRTYAANDVSTIPTAETTRISERTTAFLDKYQDTREEFRTILDEVKSTFSS